jgi:hypothetical protein
MENLSENVIEALEEEFDRAIESNNALEVAAHIEDYQTCINFFGQEMYCDAILTAVQFDEVNSLIFILDHIETKITKNIHHLEHAVVDCLSLKRYEMLKQIVEKYNLHYLLTILCSQRSENYKRRLGISFDDIETMNLSEIFNPIEKFDTIAVLKIAVERNDEAFLETHLPAYLSHPDIGVLIEEAQLYPHYQSMIIFLFSFGIPINNSKYDYLAMALTRHDHELVKILLDAGIDISSSIKKYVSKNDRGVKTVNLLLQSVGDSDLLATYLYCISSLDIEDLPDF